MSAGVLTILNIRLQNTAVRTVITTAITAEMRMALLT